jgi:hypothetical protein
LAYHGSQLEGGEGNVVVNLDKPFFGKLEEVGEGPEGDDTPLVVLLRRVRERRRRERRGARKGGRRKEKE